ncbi:MAG: PIN domain-containing protein [Oscillospiraceae bacterium]|nr:PIN domain-containing protein [Oscillospiraceae bacterium]
MKIVIDNNVVLDALLARQPFNEAAESILIFCADTHIGFLTTNSLTDIFFILQKTMNAPTAKAAIKKLIELFVVIAVDEEDCVNALSLPMDDFEDALIASCAKKVGADYIVTRDEVFIKADSPVKAVLPSTFLQMKNTDKKA